ncbi:peptidase S8 [Halomonas sp. DQ26W]|uniref:S8 family peptidase n=1 Tax=Halomonas sp. DQ26W TaxID=2282311 RepID=UPI000DF863B9|nr:S8 family serine peptidase [Halomonas sp. DQ26W]RDB44563.1 peptidase S8 [Halomonas sp. DQ26W]
MLIYRFVSTLILPAAILTLTACGGGGGGGGTKPTNDKGTHEPELNPSLLPRDEGSVLVGVADTGFRITHETLAPALYATVNLVDGSDDVSGDEDHGTAVASLTTLGSSEPQLYLAKVSSPDFPGRATVSVLDYSVGYLADEGARVINHSWGGRYHAPAESSSYLGVSSLDSLQRIVTSNDGLGSIYVVSAGNDGETLTSSNPIHQYEDIYARMLIVGGSTLNEDGEIVLKEQSNHPGADADWQARFLTAPWATTAATAKHDASYATWGGTSIAAPQVAQYAAAMIELWPHLDAATVSKRLLETADQSSPLYGDTSCGSDGSVDCGFYYLGQGEADIGVALEPDGSLALAAGTYIDGDSHSPGESFAQLSAAYGDSLAQSGVLKGVAAFDDLGRDYRIDLSQHSGYREQRRKVLRTNLERISASSPQQRQEIESNMGMFRFTSRVNGHGETLSSRLDGSLGKSDWTLFQFGGNEVDPLSAYGESGFMPLLSFQAGSELTGPLETVMGLRTEYPLIGGLDLVAKHWSGDAVKGRRHLGGAYQAARTDFGLRMSASDRFGITATMGSLEESHGLLGGQGSGALSLGERNRTAFSGLAIDANLGGQWQAFAHYERGQGEVQGSSGFIQHIDKIRTDELGMGVQWSGSRHSAALAYRQPMRISDATVTLSVPVGRTLDGRVIHEERTADLAPSGRQQDIELGYRFQASKRGVLQLNLSHTLEPGHDRAARSDSAAVINYQVAF